MAAASNYYKHYLGQRFQGRGISIIIEKPRPILRDRAKEIVAQTEGDRDAFGWQRYSHYITCDELLATHAYFQNHAAGCWSQNDVLRQCAK